MFVGGFQTGEERHGHPGKQGIYVFLGKGGNMRAAQLGRRRAGPWERDMQLAHTMGCDQTKGLGVRVCQGSLGDVRIGARGMCCC